MVVLAGGLSHERDVSLRSGRRVAEALRETGVEVEVRDVDADLLRALREDPPDCVVPLLHGETGEDGAVREVLELVGLPYVGSRPSQCRAAFDKPVAKSVVARAGVHTPLSVTLPAETFRELGAATVMDALVARVGLPLIVKPARGGSALGCTVVRDQGALAGAMVTRSRTATPRSSNGWWSASRWPCRSWTPATGRARCRPSRSSPTAASTTTPPATPPAARSSRCRPSSPTLDAAECARVAVTAHEALGLRDLSRSDLMVDADGTVWFLEVNVAPGLTETSTVPLAVTAAGLDLGDLMAELVRAAVERGLASSADPSTGSPATSGT